MKSKVQIKSIFGSLLFEFECETLEEAVVEAVSNRADLSGADLSGADLYGANLRGANLRGANLYGANLRGANLRGANLRRANLYGTDLYGANLRGADLRGANLRRAKNIPEFQLVETIIVPEGDIIGWKKCQNNVLVKVLIPKEAKRSNASGRKCRAEYVKVLELIDMSDKRKKVEVALSTYNGKTEYRKGETVKCNKWDEERFNECSGGIHFFITREEAEDYC